MKKCTYKMPAEWEKHEATWLSWPHNVSHWPGKFEPIPGVFAKMVKALAANEKVYICVNDKKMEDDAMTAFKKEKIAPALLKNVKFFYIKTDASWARDHGPIFVHEQNLAEKKSKKKKLIITDWVFNAWGKKYKPWDQDDIVPQKIGKKLGFKVIEPGIVMEGGSIDVNGKGTLLTTKQCLLNKNRNPHLSRQQIENYLNKYLGARHFLWLKEGIVGDDTDGHIDDIARFTDERTIVCAVEKNAKDENYKITQQNFADLKKMKDQDGKKLKIVALPMPDPVIYEGQRLPASYANFYIANKVVLLPTFNCKQDAAAKKILQKLFPKRKIIGIDCIDLVWGLGTFHCSTQQQPAK